MLHPPPDIQGIYSLHEQAELVITSALLLEDAELCDMLQILEKQRSLLAVHHIHGCAQDGPGFRTAQHVEGELINKVRCFQEASAYCQEC